MANASTVTNCTAEALLTAIATGGEITLACQGVITLANPIVIAADTTLQAGGEGTSISGTGGTNGLRLFQVRPGVRFTLRNLSLINGRVQGQTGQLSNEGERATGGAILNQGGLVTLLNVTVSGHEVTGGDGGAGLGGASGGNGQRAADGGAGLGAAIYNEGGVVLASNVIFNANSATGGRGGEGGPGGADGNGGNGGDGGNAGIGAGAAIYNSATGTLTVMDCTFTSNRVTGAIGGVGGLSGGALGITGRNGASGWGMGAAIYNDGGTVAISNSTFTQNSGLGGAGQHEANGVIRESDGFDGTGGGSATGGALFNWSGPASVTNCTFTANNLTGGEGGNGGNGNPDGFGGDGGNGGAGGDAAGGAIANGPNANTTVVNCTFGFSTLTPGAGGTGGTPGTAVARPGVRGASGMSVGTALSTQGSPLTVKNSIISGVQGTAAVGGPVTDAGFNLVSDASLNVVSVGTRWNINPLLHTLADNGGETATLALSSDSPAINAITEENGCPSTDQRHAPRSGFCDIGAYEFGTEAPGLALGVQLHTDASPKRLELFWPVSPASVLEASGFASASWAAVTDTPTIQNGLNVLTLPATNQQRFFRLRNR
ncbi:MAG: hypothetical protein L0Z50_31665 [Verrucomicrobiales bacterium]|nr:hypothetical protein [Verrucomicrobiales bacterium]